ncbi:hypothetical protein Moror_7737 [Moniliophthora roreri MCA 2997]|uniref:Yeast cell wall synthesis Kre9/Knh1-like N-terminal domain-containing protein n=2 Tax=Moniliophthora roreri TaxID=221103 RepID=V2WTP7_MONRO|nr:hypothetical protein Moror_7737 [Moniliophthora roreri MCA 2997]KAI3615186.1 hypothetical protein WG66_003599 [Moniliophthora roreri]
MQFKACAILSAIAATISSVTASPLQARKALDVWAPTIISPDASTVWVVGTTVNVTWDPSNAPVNISNGAAVLLNKGDPPRQVQYLKDFRSFDLRTGWVEVTVPDVEPDTDYFITLFGDSGNWSDKFEIVDSGEVPPTGPGY